MNRSYTLIWNSALNTWVVASEGTRRRGKGGPRSATSRTLLAAALLSPALGFASGSLPTDGNVVSGVGSIGGNSQHMVIDQSGSKLAINWQSFNIGSGNSVTFNQPGANAIALNRVLGADGSKILGNLNANGQVFLINPNGVLFGSGAQVDVGGLVASTLDLSVEDFNAGNYRFGGNGTAGSVINQGSITAADGGAVALLGGTVRNDGSIVANLGTVALAAGDAMTLDFAGDGLLNVQIDQSVKDALVENHLLIQADGGHVLLTASAADALLETVVNNTGVIQARTLSEREGKIVLLGDFDGGTVQVAGTLDASAPDSGNGGFIDTSGAVVRIAEGTQVTTLAENGTTGTWLIDPTDIRIVAGTNDGSLNGTDIESSESLITNGTLNAALANTNVTLTTLDTGTEAGDIHIDAEITWNSDTTLTLSAHRNININQAITATGESAGLVLNHGGYVQRGWADSSSDYHLRAPIMFSGNNATLAINGDTYTLIRNMADLQYINNDLTGRYALAHSLDASNTTYAQALVGRNTDFNGTFAGLGHTIRNLVIDGTANNVGLFGGTGTSSIIRDIGLVEGSVTGVMYVGTLVGTNSGTIKNAYSSSSANGHDTVGGLVGYQHGALGAQLIDAYASGSVTGQSSVGGLIGYLTGSYFSGGQIRNTYASGKVEGNSSVGGLIGRFEGPPAINHSYWNIDTTGQNSSPVGIGISDTESKHGGTYNDWDISGQGGERTVWRIYEGHTGPLLRSFLQTVTVTADLSGASTTYHGQPVSGTPAYTTDLPGLDPALLEGTLAYASTGALPGTYRSADGTLIFSGLYSSQQGYDIVYAPAEVQITGSVPAQRPDVPPSGYTTALATLMADEQESVPTPDAPVLKLVIEAGGIKLPAGL